MKTSELIATLTSALRMNGDQDIVIMVNGDRYPIIELYSGDSEMYIEGYTDCTTMEYKGYKLNYYGDSGIYKPFKARPYDDADYYWAQSADCKVWNIAYKGKLVCKMEGSFKKIVDYLESYNKSISPKISNW